MKERKDPQWYNPNVRPYIETAELEAEKQLAAKGLTPEAVGMGYCHMVWAEQKEILKTRFGIDWKTPAEMNPDTLYD